MHLSILLGVAKVTDCVQLAHAQMLASMLPACQCCSPEQAPCLSTAHQVHRSMTNAADRCNTTPDFGMTVRLALSCRSFSVCSGILTTLWAWAWGR